MAMPADGLLFGLLDAPLEAVLPELRPTYRELTLAWTRFGYRGEIIEERSVDAILARACASTVRYCVVLTSGWVIKEFWQADRDDGGDFMTDVMAWVTVRHFLVAGRLDLTEAGYRLGGGVMIVDLQRYEALGRPPFQDSPPPGHVPPRVTLNRDGDGTERLDPDGDERLDGAAAGSGLLAASLRAGFSPFALPPRLTGYLADLAPRNAAQQKAFAGFAKSDIGRFGDPAARRGLSAEQAEFLESVYLQTQNSRHGVFLWNIEPYDDVESPPPDHDGPVTSLYSVAAGFKPNRILATHGLDATTRIVFFDYSRRALEVRRELVEVWDGRDFVDFALHLFEKFPHPRTFYQLWQGATPETVSRDELQGIWNRELARWGGGENFAAQWRDYRELEHSYIHCDLLQTPEALLVDVRDERNAVMWFSNAFFTFQANWHMSFAERRTRYESFSRALASAAPALHLYGADFNNRNVNCVQAADYWATYSATAAGELDRGMSSRHAVRM